MAQQGILVVDDDPGYSSNGTDRAHQSRLPLIHARHGHEAMRLWRDHGADLVVTDLYMPDKEGLEAVVGSGA